MLLAMAFNWGTDYGLRRLAATQQLPFVTCFGELAPARQARVLETMLSVPQEMAGAVAPLFLATTRGRRCAR